MSDASGFAEGLDAVFQYAHHSNMLQELQGVRLLFAVCRANGLTRYVVDSPANLDGLPPSTPSHGLLVDGENVDRTQPQGASNPAAPTGVISADLSGLGMGVNAASEASADPAGSRVDRVVRSAPRRPSLPRAIDSASRHRIVAVADGELTPAPAQMETLSGAQLLHPHQPTHDFEYTPRSTQGKALTAVFAFTMRLQARSRVQQAKAASLSLLLEVADSPSSVPPFSGLQLLHSACLAKKQAEPYHLAAFPTTAWNNLLTKHQRQRLLLSVQCRPRRELTEEDLFGPPSPTAPSSRRNTKPKRLTSAEKFSRRIERIKDALADVRTVIHKIRTNSNNSTLRSTAPTSRSNGLPSLHTQDRSKPGQTTTGAPRGAIVLPHLPSAHRTAGSGRMYGLRFFLEDGTSHASRVVQASSAPCPPAQPMEAAGSVQAPQSARTPLKHLKHRLMSHSLTARSDAAVHPRLTI